MKKLILSLSGILSICLVIPVFAADACSKISCDCSVLDQGAWKSACVAQEKRLKAGCKTKKMSDGAYCSLHGPAANALPLELMGAPAKTDKFDIDDENRKVASLLWSIREDWNMVADNYDEGKIPEATQLLVVADHNVDSLYKAQVAIAGASGAGAKEVWKQFATDTRELAENWEKRVRRKESDLNAAGANNASKRLVGQGMHVTGKLFELAGLAYGKAGSDSNAALMWKASSSASSKMIGLLIETKDDVAKVTHLRNVAAARLNRASYHALRDDDEAEAEALLKASQEFVANQLLEKEILASETN